MGNEEALTDFIAARDHFLARRFAKAREIMRRYRQSIDYLQFEQSDNRPQGLPQVSVIIVSYATGTVLLDCLKSVFNQTGTAFELILVDNGGNDSVHSQLSNQPLLWIKSPVNLLPSEGRNLGAHFARGSLLIFLDDDSLMAPGFISEAQLAMQTQRYLALRGRVLPRTSPHSTTPAHYDLGSVPHAAKLHVEGNMVIRSEVFSVVGGFDPLLFGYEGEELGRRYLERFPDQSIFYWPDLIIYHDYAKSNRLTAKLERQELAVEYLQYLKEHPVNTLGLSILIRADDNLAIAKDFLDSLIRHNSYKPIEATLLSRSPKQALDIVRPFLARMFVRVLPADTLPLSKIAERFRYDNVLVVDLPTILQAETLSEWVKRQQTDQSSALLCKKASLANLADTAANVSLAQLAIKTRPALIASGAPIHEPPKIKKVSSATLTASDRPKISIIVPMYNVSAFIEHCLDSLLCQTFRDFEVICVDDQSKDNTSDLICRYLKDSRFRLIVNYENQGLPSARNLGILSANGEYMYFVDSDDWVSPDALQRLIHVAERDQVDIVIGGVAKSFDVDGHLETPDNHGRVMAIERSGTNIYASPELFFSVTSWNKLIKSDFIKDQGLIFKTTPRRFEDMLTYKWYLSGARVSNISEVTYYYRQRVSEGNNGSIMQDTSIDAFVDKLLAYKDIFEFLKKKGLILTKVDPLHSEMSMMNLPRALSWIIPKIYSSNTEDRSQLARFTIAAQQLVSLFDESYIQSLPDRLQKAVFCLQDNDTCKALINCEKLFASKG